MSLTVGASFTGEVEITAIREITDEHLDLLDPRRLRWEITARLVKDHDPPMRFESLVPLFVNARPLTVGDVVQVAVQVEQWDKEGQWPVAVVSLLKLEPRAVPAPSTSPAPSTQVPTGPAYHPAVLRCSLDPRDYPNGDPCGVPWPQRTAKISRPHREITPAQQGYLVALVEKHWSKVFTNDPPLTEKELGGLSRRVASTLITVLKNHSLASASDYKEALRAVRRFRMPDKLERKLYQSEKPPPSQSSTSQRMRRATQPNPKMESDSDPCLTPTEPPPLPESPPPPRGAPISSIDEADFGWEF